MSGSLRSSDERFRDPATGRLGLRLPSPKHSRPAAGAHVRQRHRSHAPGADAARSQRQTGPGKLRDLRTEPHRRGAQRRARDARTAGIDSHQVPRNHPRRRRFASTWWRKKSPDEEQRLVRDHRQPKKFLRFKMAQNDTVEVPFREVVLPISEAPSPATWRSTERW